MSPNQPASAFRPVRLSNVIGPAVVRMRSRRDWTQDDLVVHLQLLGYDVTRDIIANIEIGRSSASDTLVFALAQAFDVPMASLFPSQLPVYPPTNRTGRPIHGTPSPLTPADQERSRRFA